VPEHGLNTEIDAAGFPAQNRRMAKKAAAKGRAGNPLPAAGPQLDDGAQGTAHPTKLKPSSLLDTRVIYCGDNLEHLAKLPDACATRMQKEEGRMMKPARSAVQPSSFILLPLQHASHYVKVMLDQTCR
jgi:hypothetical protein